MESAGFTKIAAIFGLTTLENNGFIECHDFYKEDGFGNSYFVIKYSVIKRDLEWLLNNRHKLSLKLKREAIENDDDNLPF